MSDSERHVKKRKTSPDNTAVAGGTPGRAASERASPTGSETEDDDTWTEGDFEIITSDNVRFKVPSYHLLSASPIFRDAGGMAAAPKPDPHIHFTDPDCETAYVFRMVMKLVAEGRLWEKFGKISLPIELAQVFVFLTKWECLGLLAVFEASLRALMHYRRPSPNYVRLLVIAAKCGDQELCRHVIRESGHYLVKHLPPDELDVDDELFDSQRDIPNTTHLWSRLPLWFHIHCPRRYAFAVAQAWGARDPLCAPNGRSLSSDFSDWLLHAQDRL